MPIYRLRRYFASPKPSGKDAAPTVKEDNMTVKVTPVSMAHAKHFLSHSYDEEELKAKKTSKSDEVISEKQDGFQARLMSSLNSLMTR